MRLRAVGAVLAVSAALLLTSAGQGKALSAVPAKVVELKTATPAWYTAELHSQVLEAAKTGGSVPLPTGAEVPASALLFTGIRPGSWMLFPAGCTMNFVFGTPGNYSIGTAGHCAAPGDQVTIVAAPGILMNIGTTTLSVNNGVGDDFALIKVSPEMQQYVNPSVAYFGGPTGKGDPQSGAIVEHVGHGLVIGTGGTPRVGVVVYRGPGEKPGSDAFAWVGLSTPGDSGSPVLLTNGAAAGDLTHLVIGGPYVPGNVAGTSIARMVVIAGMGLATAPVGPAL